MQYEATDAMGLVALITWACLNTPDLFDTVQAASAPSLSWFKSLSATIPMKVWGIYVLVLKKQGLSPLLYIGSGTAAAQGVRSRLHTHARREQVPRYIANAYRGGCEITHKTLLAYCPIPGPADIPTFRHLVVALEAALCCVFWPMYHRDNSYGLDHLCPWPRETLEWNGLCSHNPLRELVNGDLNLTPEQLESIAAATKENARRYAREYARNVIAPDPERKARYQKAKDKRRDKKNAKQKAREDEIKEAKRFYCTICDIACASLSQLQLHNDTTRHKKKMVHGAGPFHCAACNISFPYPSGLKAHLETKRHKQNVLTQY